MDERRKEEICHRLTMTNREKITLTGVEDVGSFDDDRIIAYTTGGQMTVKGAELKINRLSVEDGELEIEGEVDSIEYSDGHKKEKSSIFGKIFK